MQAWNVVDELYFDADTLSRINWPSHLERGMWRASTSETPASAYHEISTMLLPLGDPYTRIVPPSLYDEFRVSSEGEVTGVGLLLASDPSSKHLVVVEPLANGPADKAGVRRGDVLLAIDGRPVDGLDGEAAGRLLRGQTGTSVSVQLARPSDSPPGVPARPTVAAPLRAASPVMRTVTLQRATVPVSSVFATRVAMQGQQLGYIRLMTFSSNSVHEMRRAVASLTEQNVKGYILDLRNNPGGLVAAGIDIAHLWLDGSSAVFDITGRDSSVEQTVTLEPGAAAVPETAPLAVLVNSGSASASEILAGALRDNGRARIVGDSATYGKGRIQSVYELDDGSALFLTVARYKTPAHAEIDHVGIRPDIKCTAPTAPDDAAFLPIEYEMYGPQPLAEQLFSDPCFIVAGKAVSSRVTKTPSTPKVPALPQLFAQTASSDK